MGNCHIRNCIYTIVMTLVFLAGASMARAQDIPADPLGQEAIRLQAPSVPSEAEDGVLQLWQSRNKYYLLIAANRYSDATVNMPFVVANTERLSAALEELGYTKLGDGVLVDEKANKNQILDVLSLIPQQVLPPAKLFIYYAGHGVKDSSERDLFLQLYGDRVGEYHGIRLSEIIEIVRKTGYTDDLIIVVDACFSGSGVLLRNLNQADLANTAILTSASGEESSYDIEVEEGKSSAFSYFLLQGLLSDWSSLDAFEDGVITIHELEWFTAAGLRKSFKEERIFGPMTPHAVSVPRSMLVAYRRDRVKNWFSVQRGMFASVTIDLTKSGLLSGTIFRDLRDRVDSISITAGGSMLAKLPVTRGDRTTAYFQLDPFALEGIQVSLKDSSGSDLVVKTFKQFKGEIISGAGSYAGPRANETFLQDSVVVYTDLVRKVGAEIDIAVPGEYFRYNEFDVETAGAVTGAIAATASAEPPLLM